PSSRVLTSLDPMKPVAPVTRMGSSVPMSRSSCAVEVMATLLGDVGFTNGSDADRCEQPADVIAELDQARHEPALTQKQSKGKDDCVHRRRDHRFGDRGRSRRWM